MSWERDRQYTSAYLHDFKEYPSLFNISLSFSSPGDVSNT